MSAVDYVSDFDSDYYDDYFTTFVIREVCASLSVIATLLLIISYLLNRSVQIPSFKIFFFLGIAEALKAIAGILKFEAYDGNYCLFAGISEVYTQSCCLASLGVMAFSMHLDSNGESEEYINSRINFSPILSFVIFPVPLCLL